MRVLFDDPSQVNPALYRRFLHRALFRGYMSGTVVSPATSYLNLNALILDGAELASLVELSTCFARIFALAGERVAEDIDALLAYGFPLSFAELLRQEVPRPVVFGRFDYLVDESGHWQLIEYNSDTPAGFREATAVDQAAFELLRPYFSGSRVNEQLVSRRLAALRASLPQGRRSIRLGFLTDASDLEDTGHMAYTEQLVRSAFAAQGIETVLGDVHNLGRAGSNRVTLLGRPIDALYRYVTYEALLATPQFWMMAEAVATGKLSLVNGFRGMLLQDKGLLAWIWGHRGDPLFSGAEQSAIALHMPPTWWIHDLPAEVDRRKTVVKQVFGREGNEVYFGDSMSEEDWERCRGWGTFVVQQRVDSPTFTAVGWDLLGRPERRTRWATVGGYVAGEQWAGCYSRLGSRIVNAQAEFVPTFSE